MCSGRSVARLIDVNEIGWSGLMGFPTSEMVSAMSWYWKFQSLRDLLLERHPEWDPRVDIPDGKNILKVTLADEPDRGVGLAVVRARYTQV